jgi:very-short-patch-repair endonuclease
MRRIAIAHRMPWQPWAASRDKLAFARAMRKQPTPSEAILWSALRRRQLDGRKFRRQHIIAGYVVDFYCPELWLAVEVDGPIHQRRVAADRDRTEDLRALGVTVLRIASDEVLERLPAALQAIRSACRRLLRAHACDSSPHPDLPPQRGKEQRPMLQASPNPACDEGFSAH